MATSYLGVKYIELSTCLGFLQTHIAAASGGVDASYWIGYSRNELTLYSPYTWKDGSTSRYT